MSYIILPQSSQRYTIKFLNINDFVIGNPTEA